MKDPASAPWERALGLRVLLWMSVVCALFSGLSALVQVGLEYRLRTREAEQSLQLIERSHLGGLENSLWAFELELTRAQMEGVLKMPHVAQVELITTTGERWALGVAPRRERELVRRFPLRHGDTLLGELVVRASLEDAYAHLWRHVALNLAGNAFVICFTAAALLLVFRRLVTRRIERLAASTRTLGLEALDRPLVAVPVRIQDELDALAVALDEMRKGLLDGFRGLSQAQDEIRGLNGDLTQANEALREAKERAETASRAKSAFLARMSHELMTPLNQIVLGTDLVAETLATSDPAAFQDLRRVREAAFTLKEMINDTLDLVDLDSGTVTLQLVDLNPTALLSPLQERLRPWLATSGNRFRLDLAPELDRVHLDPGRTRQILAKLLHNACKFTRNGEIHLSLQPDGDGVRFAVRDSGPGIPAESLHRLFEAFSQADEGLTRAYDGSGLGLALSHHLARIMGGRIEVESEVGRGSCFTLHLPGARPSGP